MQESIYVILLLGICMMVYYFIKQKSDRNKKHTVELMKSFTNEMVQENQKFLQHLGELNVQVEEKIEQLFIRLERVERKVDSIEFTAQAFQPEEQRKYEDLEKTQLEMKELHQDTLLLHERYKEVFQLYRSGSSVEEISRLLGFGKGELELILQLAGEINNP